MILSVLALAPGNAALAQVTQRVSVGRGGIQGNDRSSGCSVSADARFIAFSSDADNLVLADTNGSEDVFVRDRSSGTTERVSVDSNGVQANGRSFSPSISADGRHVAFWSLARNLVGGDTNGVDDIFVRDRIVGTTERVSVGSNGQQGDSFSWSPVISPDGRFVAFTSFAGNLVSGDTNFSIDAFVRDRISQTTELISITPGGTSAGGMSAPYAMSADGRFVIFDSDADDLVPGDTNFRFDVFLRDRLNGSTERVSIGPGGAQGDENSSGASVSADGRFVAFVSWATNLVPGDTNDTEDAFLRDRQAGTTERLSVDSGGVQGDSFSSWALISGDGRYAVILSRATNFVPGDTNSADDVFLRDRQTGAMERLSVASDGTQANASSSIISVSPDFRYHGIWSLASNLAQGDTNALGDVFLRDRFGAPAWTSLCEPGVGGVIACPCANPPGAAGRGCDNSAATGGAVLSASGGDFLSSDSLVFRTSGEPANALSLLLQGNAYIPAGIVYGQGVRCVGGALQRLYTKSASGGGITAPDFGAGDPTVSVRSAALGSTIRAGQSRWYLVVYRDSIVLGGCPPSSTFNATQAGEVGWMP